MEVASCPCSHRYLYVCSSCLLANPLAGLVLGYWEQIRGSAVVQASAAVFRYLWQIAWATQRIFVEYG